ncbi:DUF4426 domain-containing protein [Aliikangiella marina]|uniref:DUF4426 domain-containing protein n=1 Tax=Aliikangiella marina TaxID=1712262 RepID=A0A545TA20_9GAMM|nr:DUF4426 domain-containing protein [Aliikangiella marina]TQV74058.1 DUF4426 domain-containing protein [Aliikangiella marina]
MFLKHANLKLSIIIATCFLFAPIAQANVHTIGDITIHYNALSTANIPAEVAAAYKIRRSGRTGIVNITVMKNDKPVIANVFGNGKNLTGQLKELAFKEIREDQAVYYIATFTFNNSEKLSFDLQIQPERKGKLIPLTFRQELFID